MPCVPRSSNVSAKPVPNNCSHNRFTIVLDVNGFSLLVIHIANPSLLCGMPAGIEFSECGTSASTTFPFDNQLPLSNTCEALCMYEGLSIITGVEGRSKVN